MPIKLQIRRGTASQWTSANPTLLAGEIGYETDTGNFKIGDGTTGWTSLAYQFPYMTGSKALDTTTLVVDQANDRVGIGISSPTQKLDVVGTVKATVFSGYGVSPIGSVTAFAGSSAPTGWLLCNGATVSQATYADLYALIGTTYGPASGGNFTLPDLRGRTAVGVNTATYLTALGQTTGSADASVISHTHAHTLATDAAGAASGSISIDTGGTSGVFSTGTGVLSVSAGNAKFVQGGGSTVGTRYMSFSLSIPNHTHGLSGSITANGTSGTNANLQPSIALNYIIRAL